MLRFMGSQRVGHDWATELNWIYAEKNIWQTSTSNVIMKIENKLRLDDLDLQMWIIIYRIDTKPLLYSTGNDIQYPMINYYGKEYVKEKINKHLF